MSVYFDSKDPCCKSPFGAVLCGTEVSFAVFFGPEDGILGGELQVREEFAGVTLTISLHRESSPPGHIHRPRDAGAGLVQHHAAPAGRPGRYSLPERQLTVYEDTVTPDWFGRGVSYQIFLTASAAAASRTRRAWWETEGSTKAGPTRRTFCRMSRERSAAAISFGGDLPGIIGKLDYLQELGVTTLYLTPIFESASNHRYNTADYRAIDPMLGTEEDFCALCSHAHRAGMRVVLDGVFNHTGSVSRYFNADGSYPDLGAAQSKESPLL